MSCPFLIFHERSENVNIYPAQPELLYGAPAPMMNNEHGQGKPE